MICVADASLVHVGPVATRMRAIDRLECCIFGHSPKSALRRALATSVAAWTAKVDGSPVAMFGVTAVSTLEGIGSPWMLGTNEAPRHPRAMLELGRDYLAEIQRLFPRLENRVHADNAASIRWLSRLGFTIAPDCAMVSGEPMRLFWKG